MTRTDESVSTSVERLIAEERNRRLEQLRAAKLRMQEAEQAERAERERLAAQQAEREIQDRDRERQRVEADRNRLALQQAEQRLREKACEWAEQRAQQELRLSFERDARVQGLKGAVRLLASLLGTVVVGAVVLHLTVLAPSRRRLAQDYSELLERHQASLREAEREHRSPLTRVREGEERIRELESKPSVSVPTQRPETKKPNRPPTARPQPPRPCNCDPFDPLCTC